MRAHEIAVVTGISCARIWRRRWHVLTRSIDVYHRNRATEPTGPGDLGDGGAASCRRPGRATRWRFFRGAYWLPARIHRRSIAVCDLPGDRRDLFERWSAFPRETKDGSNSPDHRSSTSYLYDGGRGHGDAFIPSSQSGVNDSPRRNIARLG